MRRKYPFATMAVGQVETIQTAWKPRAFHGYVHARAAKLNRRFTTLHLGAGVFEVRRIDGLPDEDKLARNRSRSATLMHARRKQKQENVA